MYLNTVQVLDLQARLAREQERDDIIEAHAGCEQIRENMDDDFQQQLDQMQEERDAAIDAYAAREQRIVDELYEIVDNESIRARLLDVVYGTVE